MKGIFPSLLSAINEKFGSIIKGTHPHEDRPATSAEPETIAPAPAAVQDPTVVREKVDKLKHQFMANISHEIRTPMNAIVGMSRLLIEKNPDPDQLRYLNAIQLSANNLMSIISDILDITKIEAGKILIEQKDFNFRYLLQGVQDFFQLKAEEKDIELRIMIEDGIPNMLKGDPVRLNQVLTNLLGNGIKFTEKGFVELSVTQLAAPDGFMLKFDVADTGIGIAPENIDSIFESFVQEGMESDRKFGGTGLGLTICRELTHLMGGDLNVKSELGKGTVFTLLLPFKLADEPLETATPVIPTPVTNNKLRSRLKVLLVEDNEFNRLVALDTLNETLPAAIVDQAVNGEEAVEMVRNNDYDIILMDIQMPVMDGVTATKIIRNALPVEKRDVNILALTANVLQEDLIKYFDVGIDDYVAKPFQIEELLAKMEQLLVKKGLPRLHELNLPVEAPSEESTTAPEQDTHDKAKVARNFTHRPLPEFVTDKEFLSDFTGGNPERMRKYVKMFMENATKLLISMDLALQAKDYAAIKIAAHSLKPQLSYMGVKEDVSHIFMIEQSAGSSAHVANLEEEIIALNKVVNKAFEELKHLV